MSDDPSVRALVKSRVTIQRLTTKLAALHADPCFYAPVIEVIDLIKPATEEHSAYLEPDIVVRVIKSQEHPELVGKIGIVMSEVDTRGQVTVGFDNGARASFNVGLPETPDVQPE